MNRRNLIMGGVSGLLAPLFAGPLLAAGKTFFGHNGTPLGLQMGVVGPEFDKEPVKTLRTIRSIGYRSVEINVGVRDPAGLRMQLDDAGLACTSGIISMGPLSLDKPGPLIEAAQKLRLSDVVLAALMPPAGFRPSQSKDLMAAYVEMTTTLTAEDYHRTADKLNEQGRALATGGLRLGYHNHNFEFRRFGDETGLEILLKNTEPALVSFEMDVGWVTAAGLDPITLLKAHPGRFRQMHVKEVAKDTIPNTVMNIVAAPVGTGIIDWAKVLSAARAAGIKHFYVEQDPPFAIPRTQMITEAYAYLSQVQAR